MNCSAVERVVCLKWIVAIGSPSALERRALARGGQSGSEPQQSVSPAKDTPSNILQRSGFLLAVHTDGDCATNGSGANDGWSTASIVAASTDLTTADIADR